jgi:NADH:ubiquinone oxidoreductase subunit 2 (subunit N)
MLNYLKGFYILSWIGWCISGSLLGGSVIRDQSQNGVGKEFYYQNDLLVLTENILIAKYCVVLLFFIYLGCISFYFCTYFFKSSINAYTFYNRVVFMSATTTFLLLNLMSCCDLISFFACIEGVTLCLYILAGLHTANRLSIEASLKYFLTSAIFSCLLGAGIFLVYLITGEHGFGAIYEYGYTYGHFYYYSTLPDLTWSRSFLLVGFFLFIISFLMKLGAAPLQW